MYLYIFPSLGRVLAWIDILPVSHSFICLMSFQMVEIKFFFFNISLQIYYRLPFKKGFRRCNRLSSLKLLLQDKAHTHKLPFQNSVYAHGLSFMQVRGVAWIMGQSGVA